MKMTVLKSLEKVRHMADILHAAPISKHPTLLRSAEGRLVVMGNYIDLFDLLKWIDENPLTQFREVAQTSSCPFIPPECLAHLFDGEGRVL